MTNIVMGLAITAEIEVTRDGEVVPEDDESTSNKENEE